MSASRLLTGPLAPAVAAAWGAVVAGEAPAEAEFAVDGIHTYGSELPLRLPHFPVRDAGLPTPSLTQLVRAPASYGASIFKALLRRVVPHHYRQGWCASLSR